MSQAQRVPEVLKSKLSSCQHIFKPARLTDKRDIMSFSSTIIGFTVYTVFYLVDWYLVVYTVILIYMNSE